MDEFIRKIKKILQFPVVTGAIDRVKRTVLESITKEDVLEFLQNIKLFDRLSLQVKDALEETSPDPRFKAVLKERLINFIELKKRRSVFFTWQKRLAFALSIFFVFVATFTYLMKSDIAKAKHLTYFSTVEGHVVVQRDGEYFLAESNMVLKRGDIINTGPDSSATVQFFDESVSRLSSETEVILSDLYVNPLNKTNTVVALDLRKGRVWSRVLNLVSDTSRFKVNTEDFSMSADNKAAFDIVVTDNKTEVTAVQNVLALEVKKDGKVEKKAISKGQKVKVDKIDFSSEPKSDEQNQILEESSIDFDKVWIEENLKEDEEYIAQVHEENKKQLEASASVLPGNMLYPVKEFASDFKLFLTFDEVEKSRKKLAVAKQKLIEAQVLLEKGDRVQGQALLDEYKKTVEEVATTADELAKEQPSQGIDLKAQIYESIDEHKKELSPVLPDSSLYEAKKAVMETELSVADSENKTDVQFSQAREKLMEADSLAEKDQPELAKEKLEEYKNEVSAALEGADDQSLNALTKAQEDATFLQSIGNNNQLEEKVSEVKESLDKALEDKVTSITDSQNTSPIPVVTQPSAGLEAPAQQ